MTVLPPKTIYGGSPYRDDHDPNKLEIVTFLDWVVSMVTAMGYANYQPFETKALMDGDLDHDAKTLAVVYDDAGNEGIYIKIGASGSGSWSRILDFLPGSQFVALTVTGGTVNAIEATASPGLSAADGVQKALLFAPGTNTSTTVTVEVDGVTYRVKTASGIDPVVGGIVTGMPLEGVVANGGTWFRLTSDQASAAIQAAAEAAAADAEAAAASILYKTAADRTALAALTPASAAIVHLNEASEENWWIWRSDDLSAEVAGDTSDRYVPLTGDDGSGGAYVMAGAVQTGSFFKTDTPAARIIPIADRLMGGDSVAYDGTQGALAEGSYQSLTTGIAADSTARLPGLGWIERNAGFSWAVGHGQIAVAGYAHTLGGTAGASIGVSAAVSNDTGAATTANAWARYGDAQRWPGSLGTTWGDELNISNHGSTVDDSAYGADAGGGVTRGLDLAIGGGSAAMGLSNPVSAGYRLGSNGGTARKGFIFSSTALYDYGDYKIAIEMGARARLQWLANASKTLGAYIQSDVNSASVGMGLVFRNNSTVFEGIGGEEAFHVNRTGSAVNYLYVSGGAAGNGPTLGVEGSDTNPDMRIVFKGTGTLNLVNIATATGASAGGGSALPAAPVGYMTVKIAGSNRKIPYYNT